MQAATAVGNSCKTLAELLRAAEKQLDPGKLATLTAAVEAVQSNLTC